MTADCSGVHQLPSSTARLRSLLRYRLTVSTGQTETVAGLKQRLETVLVSLATQPSLFSFFPLVRLLRPHSASTTPAQIRYDTDKSWSLAKSTNFVLSRIFLGVSVYQEVLERTTDLSDSGMFIVVGDLGYLKTPAPRMRPPAQRMAQLGRGAKTCIESPYL